MAMACLQWEQMAVGCGLWVAGAWRLVVVGGWPILDGTGTVVAGGGYYPTPNTRQRPGNVRIADCRRISVYFLIKYK
jgi:hypothetical protein